MINISGRLSAAVMAVLCGMTTQLYAGSDTSIKFNSGQVVDAGVMTFTAEGIVLSGNTVKYDAFTFGVQRSAISGSIDGGGDEPAVQTIIAVDASAIARTYPNPTDLGPGANPDVKSLANAIVTFSFPSYTYTGSALTPTFSVTDGSTLLTAGTHYKAEYSNNIHAGSATLTLTGLGDYEGTSKSAVFYISKAMLTVRADNVSRVYGDVNPSFTYHIDGFVGNDTESVLTTRPVVSTDANASSGVGNYDLKTSGAAAQDYNFQYVPGTLTVTPRDLSEATVTFDQERYPYTGDIIVPTCTVVNGQTPLENGKDYNIICHDNKQVGTAKATIAGIQNYTGQIDTTFVIYQEQLLTVIINGDSISPTDGDGGTQLFSSSYGNVLVQRAITIADNAVMVYITPSTNYAVSQDHITMNIDYKVLEEGKNPTLLFYRPVSGEATLTVVFTDSSTSGISSMLATSGELHVFDARGLLVTTATVGNSADIAACMAKLPAGLYILRINNQTIKIQKK